jgi:hypothetical protein
MSIPGAGEFRDVAQTLTRSVQPASPGKDDLAQPCGPFAEFTVTNLAPTPADYTLQIDAGLPEVTTTLIPAYPGCG